MLGLFVGNLLPRFSATYSARGGLNLEFFIKVSICLLAVNLEEITQFGLRALVVAWGETCLLLLVLRIYAEHVFQLSAAQSMIAAGGISICGSTAAVTLADIFNDHQNPNQNAEFVKVLITIMTLATIPLIPLFPIVLSALGTGPDRGGAWIGGSVDSTGGVAATASLAGPRVLHPAMIIKMLQNLLIGPIALCVTICEQEEPLIRDEAERDHPKLVASFALPSAGGSPRLLPLEREGSWISKRSTKWFKILWDKFPKFVLGFCATAVVTSSLDASLRDSVIANAFVLCEWFNGLAFVLIGLNINLRDIWKASWASNRQSFVSRLLMFYLFGQSVDLCTTYLAAWLMF
jgi:uncharacterized membrane protein YadS